MNIQELKQILPILFILATDDNGYGFDLRKLMHTSPGYLLEKINMYVKNNEDIYTNLHPLLKKTLKDYCEKWNIDLFIEIENI